MLTAFAIGFVCFFFANLRKFFVKTKDSQSDNYVFVVGDIIFSKNIDKNGTKRFFKEGQLHRIGLPAVEHADGSKEWYVNGKLHREDGPAIESATGHKAWHLNGEYHRVDGPAIEWVSGSKTWYVNGERHRTDGPAIEWYDGKKEWFVNGERHRTDGPAVEYADGGKEWYVDGEKFTETEFNEYVNSESTMTVDAHGGRFWTNKLDLLHRVNGPAVEWHDGGKSWYVNGKPHRIDGPAIERADGYKAWFVDDKCHREDGPAVEYADGSKCWFINGEPFSKSDFNEYLNSKSTMTVDADGHKLWKNKEGQYHRVDGPAIEGKDGTKCWLVNGKPHRTDGPACEWADGTKSWYVKGKRHREDGPAVEWADGIKYWYVDAKQLSEQQFNDYVNSKSTMTVDKDGNKFWKNKKDELHRTDGPAVEYADGSKKWFVNGKCHRTDGPAVEYANGVKYWNVNGKLHREDGPAVEYAGGINKSWYVNGNLHRIDGPAIEWANGHKEWFVNGKCHRTDGPAIEYVGGDNNSWYIDGKQYTESEFNDYLNSKSTMTVDKDGNKFWRNKKGQYHRVDGPAVEWENGAKEWCFNGDIHREDGPAYEDANGNKYWFFKGKQHREDGPAIELANGEKAWYRNGVFLTEAKSNNYLNSKSTMTVDKFGNKFWRNKEGKYHRVDGPACEYANGTKQWFVNGQYHRTDGPACEYSDGSKNWYVNGNRHRKDGPACEYSNGTKEWWIDDVHLTEDEFNQKINPTSVMTVDTYGNKYWKNKEGQLHREDGPAVECVNGGNEWWINGKRHRIDGPALEFKNGSKCWFVDGHRHRIDGPACEWDDGSKEWWIHGSYLSEQQFRKKISTNPTMIVDKSGAKNWYLNGNLHREDGPAVEYANGSKEWHVDGKLHREDGPACEFSNGKKQWCVDGKNLTQQQFNDYVNSKSTMIVDADGTKRWKNKNGLNHREDGPAIEWPSGTKNWYLNGRLHREDGPAVEFADGLKAWYIDGKQVSEQQFNDYVNSKSTMIVDTYGNKRWHNKEGKHHRVDGPAIEFADGEKRWFVNGKLHRVDGPAVERENGSKAWFVDGKFVKEENALIS